MNIFIRAFAIILLFLPPVASHALSGHLAITRDQYFNDKWTKILPEDIPSFISTHNIYKSETIALLLFASEYGLDISGTTKLYYDITITDPNRKSFHSSVNMIISEKKSLKPSVLLAEQLLIISFEDKDLPGKYTIQITINDKVKNKSFSITDYIVVKEKMASNNSFKNIDQVTTAIEKYNTILNIEDVVPMFKKFLENQEKIELKTRKSIIYFFFKAIEKNKSVQEEITKSLTINGANDTILTIKKALSVDRTGDQCKKITIDQFLPNPYCGITEGFHLDMLWSDFFATGRFKPIQMLISFFDQNYNSKKTIKHAIASAAKWSLESNSKKSKLLCQYVRFVAKNKSVLKINDFNGNIKLIGEKCLH